MNEWIPVTERLPEHFRPVIVCREKGKGEFIVEQGCKDVFDWWKVYGTRTKNVTHWMPFPEPPKEDKPMTNADRIRSMSDEELAAFLCNLRSEESFGFACSSCVAEEFCHNGHNGMIDWLRLPVEG